MSEEAREVWGRSLTMLASARLLLPSDPDSSASRSFYSAFGAVSALFLMRGRSYSKHSAVMAAVHRDLVKTGEWEQSLGADYSFLQGLRATGDYGGAVHVTGESAEQAIAAAERILEAVSSTFPEVFTK